MLKSISALAVATTLLAAGIAQSSVSSSQYGADHLFGGGRFVFDFDPGPGELILPRDVSVEATALGGARGTGTRYYGNPSRADPAPSQSISCLEIDGNSAVIGVTDQQGNPTVQYFEDNGPPGPDPADRITPVFPVTASDAALMPKHFPAVCPPVTPPVEWGSVWSPLDSGDIAVVDGTR
ncbi:MAG TPA: hypothetical protein VFU99_00925 [Gaiellaceae bacterium]|nr:hypothetical protein [Gaiellaceae bacterium]